MKPDEIEPMPESIERLLAVERVVPRETAVDAAEVLSAMKARLGPSAAAAAPGAFAKLVGSKVFVAAVSFALGAATVTLVQSLRTPAQQPQPPAAIVVAAPPAPIQPDPAPVAAEPPPPQPAAPIQPAPAPVAAEPPSAQLPRPRAPAPPAEVTPTPPVLVPAPVTDDQLAEERAVLELARTALGRGRAAEALAALVDHEQRFPQGRLAEERDGLRVQALLSLGRIPEARAKLEAFKAAHPESILVPALEDALNEKE